MELKQIANVLLNLGLRAYVSIISDEHLNEFISEEDNDVVTLSGFKGTQGMLINTSDGENNAIYVDGRYIEQAKSEANGYKVIDVGTVGDEAEYITKIISEGNVGIDMTRWPSKKYEKLKKRLEETNPKINLVDAPRELLSFIREGKGNRRFNKVINLESYKTGDYFNKKWAERHKIPKDVFNLNVTGSSYDYKLKSVREFLTDGDGILISNLNTIAWLFNLRGSDIKYQSVFYSYAFITVDNVFLFTNADNINLEDVEIEDYEEIYPFLKELDDNNSMVLISGDTNAYIFENLKNKKYIDDVEKLREQKTDEEVFGAAYAATMDAVALTKLFSWIEEKIFKGITEKEIDEELLKYKKTGTGFVSPSFASIICADENSSIIHHLPTDMKLSENGILLIDSGSHYYYGTTDITRTLNFGKPDYEFKKHYTTVLKGVVNAKLLKGKEILISDIDLASRNPIKKLNLDYKTATGHGIGSFLSVHESPVIYSSNKNNLLKNQIFTIEPGIYNEGRFGIRIEDMVYYSERDDPPMIRNLSFVPLCMNLIETSLLTDEEIKYINLYSKDTREELYDFLKDDEKAVSYLNRNTVALTRNSDSIPANNLDEKNLEGD